MTERSSSSFSRYPAYIGVVEEVYELSEGERNRADIGFGQQDGVPYKIHMLLARDGSDIDSNLLLIEKIIASSKGKTQLLLVRERPFANNGRPVWDVMNFDGFEIPLPPKNN